MKKSALRTKLIIAVLCASVMGTMLLGGCSDNKDDDDKQSTVSGSVSDKSETKDGYSSKTEKTVSAHPAEGYTIEFAEEDKNSDYDSSKAVSVKFTGTSAEISGKGAEFSGKTLKIKSAGTYVISGELSDGQIHIDAGKKDVVTLVLDNASVSSSETSALYAEQCEKTIIILKDGTVNTLSDGTGYDTENDTDAALYVQDDLTILGNGTLNVNGNTKNGITSKDILRISGGTINVTAENHGITGKDDLAVDGCTVTVNAKNGDGLRSTNSDTEKKDLGHVTVTDSTITVSAANDAVQAEKTLTVNSGTINVTAGGGADKAPQNNSGFGGMRGNMKTNTAETADTETSESRKGLKAGGDIVINGGMITIDSYDDSIHSNGSAAINGGKISIRSGDDGVHADAVLDVTDGEITVSKSYEGLEAIQIHISGGTTDITSSDDGINAAGGNDNSGFGNFDGKMDFGGRRRNDQQGRFPQNGEQTTSSSASTSDTDTVSPELCISGGTVYVNSGGDGLDSNSTLNISGGTIILNGPVNGGNGIIDHDGNCTVTGGFLIGAGTSDMLEMPGSSSTQKTAAITLSERQSAGTLIYVTDSSGKVIAAMQPEIDYSCLILNSADLVDGSYTVYIGGTAEGESDHGYIKNASASGGTKYTEFTVSEAVTYVNQNGNTQNSGMQGNRGQRPDGFNKGSMPENFDPNNRPDNFDPNNLPDNFDPNNLPDGFDPNNRPDNFDPNNMPDGGRGPMGQGEDNNPQNSSESSIKTV